MLGWSCTGFPNSARMWDFRRANGGEKSPRPAPFNRMEAACPWLGQLRSDMVLQWPMCVILLFWVISAQQSFSFRGYKSCWSAQVCMQFSTVWLLTDSFGDLTSSLHVFPFLLCHWHSLPPRIVEEIFLEQVRDHLHVCGCSGTSCKR